MLVIPGYMVARLRPGMTHFADAAEKDRVEAIKFDRTTSGQPEGSRPAFETFSRHGFGGAESRTRSGGNTAIDQR
jgi:hypothetical protein